MDETHSGPSRYGRRACQPRRQRRTSRYSLCKRGEVKLAVRQAKTERALTDRDALVELLDIRFPHARRRLPVFVATPGCESVQRDVQRAADERELGFEDDLARLVQRLVREDDDGVSAARNE